MIIQLMKRRGTNKDDRHAVAGENQPANNSARTKKRYFWTVCLIFILTGIMPHGHFVTDLLGEPRAVGEPISDVTLKTANGDFRLSEQKGRVLVLYFSFPG